MTIERVAHNGSPKFVVGDVIEHNNGQRRKVITVGEDYYHVISDYIPLNYTKEDEFRLIQRA